MIQVKNPAGQNKPLETNEIETQSYQDSIEPSREADPSVPNKKNQDMTTGNEQTKESNNKTGRIITEETIDGQRRETYEKAEEENDNGRIKEANYTHTSVQEKRDRQTIISRQNTETSSNPSFEN